MYGHLHQPTFLRYPSWPSVILEPRIPPTSSDHAPAQDRKDHLARLHEGKDANGNPMGRDELTAEALMQLIAECDTTSNSSCAILWWIVKQPEVHRKLLDHGSKETLGIMGSLTTYDPKDLHETSENLEIDRIVV
ncbi:hypothetical protein CROQUDRAFT_663840 [Cronartium quercuum f. sp. fusiforme G11]|uniref:Cytochrome P450 n=1 Tax=Cronartium quercuum f. sp. fusiforme G11 TaxID=708437 RepID=A0A9P6N7P4_9BASI|nr:hypothetical protein CROQUDRAFT_663840 [Cronartium quercuum f. sp. fusiforme G11]